MTSLITFLKEKQLTISLAESMTGGSLAYEFVKVPGASHIFKGSLVAYQEDVKINLLHVQASTIQTYGVVSKEVAIEMALQAQKRFNSDISISVTGYAEPKKNIFVCLSFHQKHTVKHYSFESGSREDIIKNIVEAIKNLCKEVLFH